MYVKNQHMNNNSSNDYSSNDYSSNDYSSNDYSLNDYSLNEYSLILMTNLSKEDHALYDRQIRLWGLAAQEKYVEQLPS